MKIFSIIPAVVLVLLFGCVSAPAAETENAQITGVIKPSASSGNASLVPAPMVSEQHNEEALNAYLTGTQLMQQNRLREAEVYLLRALEIDPEFVEAIDHLGIVYRRLNRLADAERMYLRSISINDKNSVPFINLAVIYRIQNKYNEALELYNKVIEFDPDNPEGYYGAGEIIYSAGSYDAALEMFFSAAELYLSLNSRYIYHAYYYIGMIFYHKQRYEDALKFLEEVQRNTPEIDSARRTIEEIRRIMTFA